MQDVATATQPTQGTSWGGALDLELSAYIPISVDRPPGAGRPSWERTAVNEWDDVVCADVSWASRRLMRAQVASQDSKDAYVSINFVHGGNADVIVGSMRSAITRGDLFLWDPRCEMRMAVPTLLHMTTVLVPRAVLARAALVGSHESLEFLGALPAAPMLKHLLRAVRETLPTPSSTRRLRNVIVEGVLAALEPPCPASSTTLLTSLRLAVNAYIDDHVDDPGLSLSSIAEANAVSVRTLSRAFQGEPQTVAQLIQSRRLERARDLLARPGPSITTISDRLHFANPSHFARVFARTFGLNPSEYREQSLRSYGSPTTPNRTDRAVHSRSWSIGAET